MYVNPPKNKEIEGRFEWAEISHAEMLAFKIKNSFKALCISSRNMRNIISRNYNGRTWNR